MSKTQRIHGLSPAVFSLLGILAIGCGGSEARPSSTAADREPPAERRAPVEVVEAPVEVEEAPPPPPPPTVTVGESTPIEGAMPTLRITAPRNGATVRTGDVSVRVTLRNWELASPEGPHVHLILDDEPYIAIRDTGSPINLNELVRTELGHELTEGSHVLRMFASRGHHESVKDAGAFATVTFHYRSVTEGFAFVADAPLLTYSRPKGCNVMGERVLLDFFVTHTTLAADSSRVRWTLDGATTGEITAWEPHWIDGLTEGSHELRLTLLGADGNPIAGPFNDSARTFTVAATCP